MLNLFNRHSKWYEGFLYAEEIFKEVPPELAEIQITRSIWWEDFDDFDKGALDYINFYVARLDNKVH